MVKSKRFGDRDLQHHHLDSDPTMSPAKSNLNHLMAAAAAISSDEDNDYDRWLRIKLNLDENKNLKEEIQKLLEENKSLKKDSEMLREEHQNLKEDNLRLTIKLENSDAVIRENATTIGSLEDTLKSKQHEVENLRVDLNLEKVKVTGRERVLNQMKFLIKKLHSSAVVVMEALGGRVLPIHIVMDAERYPLLFARFCKELQTKVREWQGSHQKNHNELVQTIKNDELTIADLEEKIKNSLADMAALREELQLEKDKVVMQEQHQKILNDMKGLIEKLYLAAGAVLEGLGEKIPPIKLVEEVDVGLLDQFCRLLQDKFSEWQNDHGLLHYKVEETLEMMEGLVKQTSGGMSENKVESLKCKQDGESQVKLLSQEMPPPNGLRHMTLPSPSPPQLELRKEFDEKAIKQNSAQRNASSKSNSEIKLCRDNESIGMSTNLNFHQFSCAHCGDRFCRLGHASSKLNIAVHNKIKASLQEESSSMGSKKDVGFGTFGKRRPEYRAKPEAQSQDKKRKLS